MGKAGTLSASAARSNVRGDEAEGDLGKGLNRQAARRLVRYLAPYRGQLGLAVLAVFLRVLGVLALPRLLGFAIDAGIQRPNLARARGRLHRLCADQRADLRHADRTGHADKPRRQPCDL